MDKIDKILLKIILIGASGLVIAGWWHVPEIRVVYHTIQWEMAVNKDFAKLSKRVEALEKPLSQKDKDTKEKEKKK